MKKVIDNFIAYNNQKFHRYNSWNHCYKAFGDTKLDNNTLSLNLAFYLASWGMYRGSSGLLQKDYKIHIGIVQIIKENYDLRCSKKSGVNHSSIPKILKVIEELQNHYKSFEFETSKGKIRPIAPTDTLISKVLLGTLGCVPAFDRFFIDGVKEIIVKNEQFKSLKKSSLEKLFEFTDNNKELVEIQNNHNEYPIMKLVDMYFWQIGFDKSKK